MVGGHHLGLPPSSAIRSARCPAGAQGLIVAPADGLITMIAERGTPPPELVGPEGALGT